jgi:hypothetical protein
MNILYGTIKNINMERLRRFIHSSKEKRGKMLTDANAEQNKSHIGFIED